MTDDLGDVMSRISAIQQSLGIGQAQAASADSSTTAGSTAATSSAFDAELAAAGGAADTALSSRALLGDSSVPSAALSGLAGPADASGSTGSPVATGDGIVSDAARYLGVPYVWGGTDPSTGLDCSGLVQRVLADSGIAAPRVAADQSKIGTPVASLDQAQPGDLVFFGSPAEHVGIYVGNGKMLDAPHTGSQVRVEDVWGTPSSIRRVTSGLATGTATTAGVSDDVSQYASLFQQAGSQYGVSPALLASIASAESSGDSTAVSGAGAEGLMQLMPSTAAGLGVNPMIPSQAIDGAARLMSGYLKTMPSLSTALAAYNAGPTAVMNAGYTVPDIPETQNYVAEVEAALSSSALSGSALSGSST